MPEHKNEIPQILQALLAGNEDLISRVAAPLWARVGRALDTRGLGWVQPILGVGGTAALLDALTSFGALTGEPPVLRADGLARLLASLVSRRAIEQSPSQSTQQLVWTLPASHPAQSLRGSSYRQACLSLIEQAETELALISPFVDSPGIASLSSAIVSALIRRVKVRLFAHDALNLATPTSKALEDLRREASRMRGDLQVYSADAGSGRDRIVNPLFHAKFVICDDKWLLLGSANLTSYGLASNFEAGVLLGSTAAKEALFILEGILDGNSVYAVFNTFPTSYS